MISKSWANASVLVLRIQVDFTWFAGQYINVWKDDTTSRSYSIASRCDAQKIIELHIQHHDQGCVSRWLHDDVAVDASLQISTPLGDCFYTDSHHGKPMLMASTGTGLAPLYGIVLEAIAQEHAAPIYVYAASGEPSGLYYYLGGSKGYYRFLKK